MNFIMNILYLIQHLYIIVLIYHYQNDFRVQQNKKVVISIYIYYDFYLLDFL